VERSGGRGGGSGSGKGSEIFPEGNGSAHKGSHRGPGSAIEVSVVSANYKSINDKPDLLRGITELNELLLRDCKEHCQREGEEVRRAGAARDRHCLACVAQNR